MSAEGKKNDNNGLVSVNKKATDELIPYVDRESSTIAKIVEDMFPAETKEEMRDVVQILEEEKHVPQLYPHVVAEIPMSQSSVLDMCVQYMEHFTPHRKLRQVMLEMQSRLEALHSAKRSYHKAAIKVERLRRELRRLDEDIEDLEQQIEELERREDELSPEERRELRRLRRQLEDLELDREDLKVELDEALSGRRSAQHMIKDAMLKVVAQRKLAKRFEAEVKATGLSFEEAEMVYYVMYFTRDAEKQLRTMGRIDTGTFGAISQLPEGLRRKVLANIEFIRKKLNEGWPADGDFIFLEYWEDMLPKRTGPGEIEGVKVEEFLGYKPPKIISDKECETDDLSKVIRRPEEDVLNYHDYLKKLEGKTAEESQSESEEKSA